MGFDDPSLSVLPRAEAEHRRMEQHGRLVVRSGMHPGTCGHHSGSSPFQAITPIPAVAPARLHSVHRMDAMALYAWPCLRHSHADVGLQRTPLDGAMGVDDARHQPGRGHSRGLPQWSRGSGAVSAGRTRRVAEDPRQRGDQGDRVCVHHG